MRTTNDPKTYPTNQALKLLCLLVLGTAYLSAGVAQQGAPAPATATTAPPTAAAPAPEARVDAAAAPAKLTPQQLQVQQRKNQLAADTAQLLKLANELKIEMDKSTKDELSMAVIKKADQVEKLAHKVRDEMKLYMGN
jgi:hypothetical protein